MSRPSTVYQSKFSHSNSESEGSKSPSRGKFDWILSMLNFFCFFITNPYSLKAKLKSFISKNELNGTRFLAPVFLERKNIKQYDARTVWALNAHKIIMLLKNGRSNQQIIYAIKSLFKQWQVFLMWSLRVKIHRNISSSFWIIAIWNRVLYSVFQIMIYFSKLVYYEKNLCCIFSKLWFRDLIYFARLFLLNDWKLRKIQISREIIELYVLCAKNNPLSVTERPLMNFKNQTTYSSALF